MYVCVGSFTVTSAGVISLFKSWGLHGLNVVVLYIPEYDSMAGLFVVRDVGGLLTFTWWWIRAGHKQSIKTKNFQQGYFWNNRVTWVIQFIAAFVEGSTHQRSDSALPQTFYCKFVLLVFLTEFYFEHANLTEITKRKELKNIKFSYIFLSAERVCLKRSRMKFILFLFLPPFSNVIFTHQYSEFNLDLTSAAMACCETPCLCSSATWSRSKEENIFAITTL